MERAKIIATKPLRYIGLEPKRRMVTPPKVPLIPNHIDIGEMVRSRPDAQVFLHRTDLSCAQKIMATGLFNAIKITSTASWSPQDKRKALAELKRSHKGNTHVVIVELPISNRDYSQHRKSEEGGIDDMVLDLQIKEKSVDTIPVKYIKGFIEVATGIFYPNTAFVKG